MAARSTRETLLDWFEKEGRDLPWRETDDPYAIWVSEIMLQQTRVDTVIPYFGRFLERFPTVESLASAPEDDVLAAWSGLGYYRRARMLQAGAKEVVARYGAKVPEGADDRLSLPGVGRYTAGAIGSIAFGKEEPLVDGNVARVLSRLRGIDTELGKAVTEKRLWAEAERLVKGPNPGDLNQALMELGATVCTPRAPACDECPIAEHCIAKATSRQNELPVKKKRRPPKEVSMVAVAARDGERRLCLVKENESLFGGLYCLPTKIGDGAAAATDAIAAHGLTGEVGTHSLGTVSHVLSHRKLTVSVFRANVQQRKTGVRFFREDELDTVGVSTLTQKLMALDRDRLL
ncbi:MAG: A/G-specific adenine glycosylase [Myxococcota bacterium]